ncbi:MAG: class I tRNA ligase family protein, partial [Thermoproteota archaeon]
HHTLSVLHNKVERIAQKMEESRLKAAANQVIEISRMGNRFLNEKKPWTVVKEDRGQAASTLYVVAQMVKALAVVSSPFIPSTAEELWATLCMPGEVSQQDWQEALRPLPSGHKISEAQPLFQKIEATAKELDEKLKEIRE